ncbi:MAG: ATP-dependent DNA helicase RecG [Bacilli bacterium]|nr:ATP-dependent DNA helicase RecG [Bacilli bacterium]
MENILLSCINYINPKIVAQLKKANIETVADLLFNYPTKFEDYTITPMDEVVAEKSLTIEAIAQSKATVANVKTKLSVMNFFVEADGHRIRVTIFNRHFLKSRINYGVYVRLTGKFNEKLNNFTAAEIHFDEFSNQINPIFNIKNVADNKILEIKEKLYREYKDLIIDDLPQDIKDKYKLIDLKKAIKYINIPEDIDEVNKAIRRIKFEELFKYQLMIKYMLYKRKNFPEGVLINYNQQLVNEFIGRLPYKLTIDQEKVLEEILNDIKSPYKMNRLLQGEVGSGKTVVAAIALYAVVTSRYQGAIMVPTEVLANQHYQTFKELFLGTDIKIVLLTSSVLQKDKKEIVDSLKNGEVNIIIGTHSLFQKDIEFKKLGLVITDEEHRFGVRQRVSIVGKGYLIDHLKMSATPIPRTLAISILGESDISVIKVLPGYKKDVITRVVKGSDSKQVIDHMKEELARGRQIYVITPMIEDSDLIDLNNANQVFEKTKLYFKDICEVGLIHSKLKTEEKESVMRAFSNNEIQILVSTSVIEVGVNIINATTIVILDADRFGIAQLHQMRGRVRRSDYQAYCFLVSDSTAETAVKRLKLVEENSDGFVLAEEDLIIRGPGDFFGEKQSGIVTFKMADLVVDKDILEIVNLEAELVIKENRLNKNEYSKMLKIVDENYNKNKEMLN